MKLNPYLTFDGQCKQAFAFYQQLLGGEVITMTYGEAPMADQVPAEAQDRIIHTCLSVGDKVLMGSDAPPGACYQQAQGIHVTLGIDDVAEAKRVFDALADNGTLQMPFDETFFAHGFGMATDRFGTPWMVICAKAC